jgi:DNA-binding transcriptional regulator GbsR (MarR family)
MSIPEGKYDIELIKNTKSLIQSYNLVLTTYKKNSSGIAELIKLTIFANNNYVMKESERIEMQKELIESIGRYLEKQGYQPVAGRVLGLLMVMDKEEYTFDEIILAMKISKSSTSAALKNLELRGVIEYITYTGDRKRYFRISFSDINIVIEGIERKIKAYADIMDRVISLKKNPNSKNSILLKNISGGTKFFLSQLEDFRNKNHK